MPSTLGHVGLQALLSGTWSRVRLARDLKWVALGCVIPDLAWIAQRIGRALLPDTDAFALRAWAVAQSSLAASLLLAFAIACLARRARAVAFLLALNCVLHLLLDGLQTKWGNGVLLAVPFDFRPWNAGLFWPESPVSYGLAALGALVLGLGLSAPAEPLGTAFCITRRRLAAFGVLLLGWALLPLGVLDAVWAADAHSLAALAGRTPPGEVEVALDRAGYRAGTGEGGVIEPYAGGPLACRGRCPRDDGRYSFRGRLTTDGGAGRGLVVSGWHAHRGGLRDAFSYVGLLGVALLWARSARATTGPSPPGAR